MNYAIFRNLLNIRDCNSLIAATSHILHLPEPIKLADGNNENTNTWYKSQRSPGMEYRFQYDQTTISMANGIKSKLTELTGINFSGGINELCLPFCKYSHDGRIKAHRDIDKASDTNKAVEYVVVCMLTQVGIDYSTINKEDTLFINYLANASNDGKLVTEIDFNSRIYPNLQKGDVIVFRNDNSIHGTGRVSVLSNQLGRITCGFRSK